jgi:hypothetical protein
VVGLIAALPLFVRSGGNRPVKSIPVETSVLFRASHASGAIDGAPRLVGGSLLECPMAERVSHQGSYGTPGSLRASRALGAGVAAGLAADQVGVPTEEAVIVAAVAAGFTAATDVAGVVELRRRFRQAASPRELAYRQGVRLWLLDFQASVEKPPSEGPSEGPSEALSDAWLLKGAREFEETLEEYMREAEAFGVETLEVALREIRDALRRQRDFGTGAGRLSRLLAKAIEATNLNEQGAEVIPETTWLQKLWPPPPFRRRRVEQHTAEPDA